MPFGRAAAASPQQYNATYEREIARDTSIRFSYLGSVLSGLIAGRDLNELAPNTTPFGKPERQRILMLTERGRWSRSCDPENNGDCLPRRGCAGSPSRSRRFPAHLRQLRPTAARMPFRHSWSIVPLMADAEHFVYVLSKSLPVWILETRVSAASPTTRSAGTGLRPGSFVLTAGSSPMGLLSARRTRKALASSMSGWANAILGGWQTSFNMFANIGAVYALLVCDDCGPISLAILAWDLRMRSVTSTIRLTPARNGKLQAP